MLNSVDASAPEHLQLTTAPAPDADSRPVVGERGPPDGIRGPCQSHRREWGAAPIQQHPWAGGATNFWTTDIAGWLRASSLAIR